MVTATSAMPMPATAATGGRSPEPSPAITGTAADNRAAIGATTLIDPSDSPR